MEHVHAANVGRQGAGILVHILGVKHPWWTHTEGTRYHKFNQTHQECDTRVAEQPSNARIRASTESSSIPVTPVDSRPGQKPRLESSLEFRGGRTGRRKFWLIYEGDGTGEEDTSTKTGNATRDWVVLVVIEEQQIACTTHYRFRQWSLEGESFNIYGETNDSKNNR